MKGRVIIAARVTTDDMDLGTKNTKFSHQIIKYLKKRGQFKSGFDNGSTFGNLIDVLQIFLLCSMQDIENTFVVKGPKCYGYLEFAHQN